MKPGSFSYSLFKQRREIFRHYLSQNDFFKEDGIVIVGGGFETVRTVFRQESNFYYLTGVLEPGAVLVMYENRDVLYLPNYGKKRSQWVTESVQVSSEWAATLQVDEIKELGAECSSYAISSLFKLQEYSTFLNDFSIFFAGSGALGMILDLNSSRNATQHQYCSFLASQFQNLFSRIKDVVSVIDRMRRIKDSYEIECLYRASAITSYAHRAAAQAIKPGMYEYELQALIESIFILLESSGPAFPSIVATGKNTTVLHYTDRHDQLKDDDLVVIDIGADYSYYASDITRTYPVSGTFLPRQAEIYNLVLETQRYIESIAQPGMYLNNHEHPEKSLQHLAVEFLKKAGYASYFCHGIGHYLGIDVHDVGNSKEPLKAGDVITIEPGIYIPEERLGVRLEDDFVIVDGGCICLSNDLPKSVDEIEALMRISPE